VGHQCRTGRPVNPTCWDEGCHVSQDFTEVANVYQAFSTKGAAARYRDEVEGFTAFEVIGPVDGQSVLDLACGFGRYGLALARRGAARVVGWTSRRT
jgi:predicted RNA methylase